MATLQEDVLGVICDDLHKVHRDMMEQAKELSTSELLARTIMGTADAIEKNCRLRAIGVCEPEGSPHYVVGLGLHYWGEVCEYEREARENQRTEEALETQTTSCPGTPTVV